MKVKRFVLPKWYVMYCKKLNAQNKSNFKRGKKRPGGISDKFLNAHVMMLIPRRFDELFSRYLDQLGIP